MSHYSKNKNPSDLLEIVSENVRKLRKQRNISQQSLSEMSGVPLITIKRFEANGKISFVSLLKMAHALKVLNQFESLFRIEEIPKSVELLFSERI